MRGCFGGLLPHAAAGAVGIGVPCPGQEGQGFLQPGEAEMIALQQEPLRVAAQPRHEEIADEGQHREVTSPGQLDEEEHPAPLQVLQLGDRERMALVVPLGPKVEIGRDGVALEGGEIAGLRHRGETEAEADGWLRMQTGNDANGRLDESFGRGSDGAEVDFREVDERGRHDPRGWVNRRSLVKAGRGF